MGTARLCYGDSTNRYTGPNYAMVIGQIGINGNKLCCGDSTNENKWDPKQPCFRFVSQ